MCVPGFLGKSHGFPGSRINTIIVEIFSEISEELSEFNQHVWPVLWLGGKGKGGAVPGGGFSLTGSPGRNIDTLR